VDPLPHPNQAFGSVSASVRIPAVFTPKCGRAYRLPTCWRSLANHPAELDCIS